MRNAGKAGFQSILGGTSSPQEKMLKELKKDTHKMLSASTKGKNIDAVVSTMDYGIGRSLESAISSMQQEAKGSGRLRNMATHLQNLVTIRDLSAQTGRPLTGKMKAFADEAHALLNEPVSNGGRNVAFSQWATTATYQDGALQSGWEPSARANMRDHMEKIQDFAKRYSAYQNPLSFSGVDSGAYLKKMQQGARRLSSSSNALSKLERTETAPGRMESAAGTPAQYSPQDIAASSQFESFPFAPHTPAAPRRHSAPAQMEHQEEQEFFHPEVSTFSPFFTSSPASTRPATPQQAPSIGQRPVSSQSNVQEGWHNAPPMSGAALRRRGAMVAPREPSRSPGQRAMHQQFQAEINTMLTSVAVTPGTPGQFDAFLHLENQFEDHEHDLHPRDRNSIREMLDDVYRQISPFIPS
jgi:hypothetical protein